MAGGSEIKYSSISTKFPRTLSANKKINKIRNGMKSYLLWSHNFKGRSGDRRPNCYFFPIVSINLTLSPFLISTLLFIFK